jgi:predicted transcriptional regulator
MNGRLTITLDEEVKKALYKLAENEYRDIHDQAILIIRKELERLGYLEAPANQPAKEITTR